MNYRDNTPSRIVMTWRHRGEVIKDCSSALSICPPSIIFRIYLPVSPFDIHTLLFSNFGPHSLPSLSKMQYSAKSALFFSALMGIASAA